MQVNRTQRTQRRARVQIIQDDSNIQKEYTYFFVAKYHTREGEECDYDGIITYPEIVTSDNVMEFLNE